MFKYSPGTTSWVLATARLLASAKDTLRQYVPEPPFSTWCRTSWQSGLGGTDWHSLWAGGWHPGDEMSIQASLGSPPWQDTVSSNASPSLNGTACRISALSIPSARLQLFKLGFLYQDQKESPGGVLPKLSLPLGYSQVISPKVHYYWLAWAAYASLPQSPT